MRARLTALLLCCATAGCGLVLDLDPYAAEGRDPVDRRDAAAGDGSIADGSAGRDARGSDATTAVDAGAARDGGALRDGGTIDARLLVDAPAGDAGTVDPGACSAEFGSVVVLGPEDSLSGSSCTGSDMIDFGCVGTMGVQEGRHAVQAAADIVITMTSSGGPGAFVLYRGADERCTTTRSCDMPTMMLAAGEMAFLAVEERGGGCGAYSIGARAP